MTPEQEANQLMSLFKEEEVHEYDIVQKHAIIRAVKCCRLMIDENTYAERNERVAHLRLVLNTLEDKLK